MSIQDQRMQPARWKLHLLFVLSAFLKVPIKVSEDPFPETTESVASASQFLPSEPFG